MQRCIPNTIFNMRIVNKKRKKVIRKKLAKISRKKVVRKKLAEFSAKKLDTNDLGYLFYISR